MTTNRIGSQSDVPQEFIDPTDTTAGVDQQNSMTRKDQETRASEGDRQTDTHVDQVESQNRSVKEETQNESQTTEQIQRISEEEESLG